MTAVSSTLASSVNFIIGRDFLTEKVPLDSYMTVVSDSHYQSILDAVYLYEVPWSEFPTVPSYPHYPHAAF